MDDQNSDKISVMIEPKTQIKEVIINGFLKNKKVEILIDSGASRNFISKKLVNEVNLIESENRTVKTMIANSEVVESNTTVDIQLTLEGINNRKFQLEPYVFKNCSFDLILGSKFLFNNGAIIDCQNQVPHIEKGYVKIKGNDNVNEDEIDKLIFEKL